MLTTTTENIPGQRIVKTLGLVSGNAVKSRNAVASTFADLKSIFGGEVGQYTKLMNDTRQLAMSRMVEQAAAKGANAVCCVRFVASEVMEGCSELCAYGTAVVCKPDGSPDN